MKQHMIVGLVAAGCALGAFADFEIKLDLSGKPMRDLSKTTSKAIVGYINAMHGPEYNDDYFFVSNRMETARVMKKAGCYNCATWSSDEWFARRNSANPEAVDPAAELDRQYEQLVQ